MKSVELKKYVREEIVMAFKLTEETYNELVDTFPIAGMDLAFGYQDGEPYLELPICGGGKEEAHIGDYIAPFGSCFRVYKQSAFEGYFVPEGEASKKTTLQEMTSKAYTQVLKKYLSCLEHFEKLARCIQKDPFQKEEGTAETVNELCLVANSCWSGIISVTAKLKALEGGAQE